VVTVLSLLAESVLLRRTQAWRRTGSNR